MDGFETIITDGSYPFLKASGLIDKPISCPSRTSGFLFFAVFTIAVFFIVLNLFIAVIFEAFDQAQGILSHVARVIQVCMDVCRGDRERGDPSGRPQEVCDKDPSRRPRCRLVRGVPVPGLADSYDASLTLIIGQTSISPPLPPAQTRPPPPVPGLAELRRQPDSDHRDGRGLAFCRRSAASDRDGPDRARAGGGRRGTKVKGECKFF